MISPTVISVLLWVPFVFVFIIAAVIFCIAGYRKGIWRALISCLVTVLSAVISFFMASLLAKVISAVAVAAVTGILNSVAPDLMSGMAIIAQYIPTIIQAVLTTVLFAVVFFVLTLILKIVANVIKRQSLQVENKGLKWAGLGVRLIDAVIYTFLLLLPLYGAIAAYSPVAQDLLKIAAKNDPAVMQFVEYLTPVAEHPLVAIINRTPFGTLYGEMSKIEIGEGSINISDSLNTLGQTADKYDKFMNAQTDEEKKQACTDLISHLKDNVIEEEWAYTAVKEVTNVMKEEIMSSLPNTDPTTTQVVDKVFDMLDTSPESFKENGVAILDYAEYALSNDVLTSVEKGDFTALKTDEFYEETATLLNATEQTAEIKEMLVTEALTSLLGGTEEVRQQVTDAYDPSAVITPEEQKAEIEAFMNVLTAESGEEVAEALQNIPSVNADVVADLLAAMQTQPTE